MKLVLQIALGIVLVAMVLLVAGCGNSGSSSSNDSTDSPDVEHVTEDRPGSAAVYADIAASTDCAELQAMFDQASANNDRAEPLTAQYEWTMGYMAAADEQMRSVGCYG